MQQHKNKKDGRYSVEAIANISIEELKIPTKFQCDVTIKQANYTSIREYIYNGEF